MKIVDLSMEHIAAAEALALDNYNEERQQVTCLPQVDSVPSLESFTENGLGVAAFEADRMLGYLACFNPWEHAFDSTARGTFVPVHAHAAVREKRSLIYKRMYQAAAEKWVKNGIGYHAIAFYAHDDEVLLTMFTYGFGQRCIDAARPMERIEYEGEKPESICFRELQHDEVKIIRDMRRSLSRHLGESPCFMDCSDESFNEWITRKENSDSRLFIAADGDRPVAFIETTGEGENFTTYGPDIRNICGAYCIPEYRGRGIYQALLNKMIDIHQSEGYTRLGVDYESINPTAAAFWGKYFDKYTISVTRRIDECALIR